MENIKESIHNEFKTISFDEWKVEAQKTLRNIDLDTALTKKLTSNISTKAIYELDQVQQYFNLEVKSEVANQNNSISLSSITELPCEPDLEIAILLDSIKRNNFTSLNMEVRMNSNFFLSIAKFRALRYLLSKVKDFDFKLIAESTDFNKSATDIENNIIRLTIEAMAAIIGGVDKVNLRSYNSLKQNDEFGKRITNNILILLKEESYLSHVKDPLSGSFLIENLTHQFIESVELYSDILDKFDSIETRNDFINEKCSEYNKEILTKLDSQKEKLIGVNIYQNKNDNINKSSIDGNRIVSSFESLKVKVDSVNPKVYIANFDEPDSLQAPLTIALNTYNIPFQISSIFELVEDAFNSIKLFDPDLVIINGSDDIMRILKNMLTEYRLVPIENFSENSILKNISIVIENSDMENNDV